MAAMGAAGVRSSANTDNGAGGATTLHLLAEGRQNRSFTSSLWKNPR